MNFYRPSILLASKDKILRMACLKFIWCKISLERNHQSTHTIQILRNIKIVVLRYNFIIHGPNNIHLSWQVSSLRYKKGFSFNWCLLYISRFPSLRIPRLELENGVFRKPTLEFLRWTLEFRRRNSNVQHRYSNVSFPTPT